MPDFLTRLCQATEPEGLNHLGIVSAERYDQAAPAPVQTAELHPGTRSIVVLGSGGRLHWERFLAHLADNPRERLAKEPHPLDAFCRAIFKRIEPMLEPCRIIFPTFDAPVRIDFVKLGELAGLGRPSELGVLVSEPFGPWFGLRAAIFTREVLPESPHVPRLCDGCPAPCRAACPPNIVGPWRFPWIECTAERSQMQSPCRSFCGARRACIVAPQARYDPLEELYHMNRAEGRRALCHRFAVTDEVVG